jgi:AcrR family transcriptional regulator
MRQLAVELGCSPMTPYRYFKDKDEILAAVRAAAFTRLAETLEGALSHGPDRSLNALACAVARAHVAFVEAEPHTYRLMFDLAQDPEENHPALQAASVRAREVITAKLATTAVTALDGAAVGRLGESQWAAVHGALTLHLAGKPPSASDLGAFVVGLTERLFRLEHAEGSLVAVG